jgi:hypothetical protein
MSAILDNITGGGLLPYIYCNKITLENSSEEGKIDVTLLLEMYQDKNRLAESTWLNSLSAAGGGNFLDAMFIQVLPFRDKHNVRKLRPSSEPLEKAGNIYTGKYYFGDAYLPRRSVSNDTYWPSWPDNGVFIPVGTENAATIPAPLQVSNSSLLGNIAGSDILLEYEAEGKIREEIVNGRPYYIIPFEYKETFDLADVDNSLGFAFYTFLDVPYWAENLSGLDLSIGPDYFEEFIVEGPINTEVVFMNGVAEQTREVFVLPNGRVWEGSAHLHASGPNGNPAPDGYSGDGALSGLTPGAPYRGWMVGESHSLEEEQQKLRLVQVPNNKLVDFRGTGVTKGPMQTAALGLTELQEQQYSDPNTGTTDFDKLTKMVGAVFQKGKEKDFVKDNDSEYSKLYVSRDRDGNARGLFFINLEELLKNNSALYSSLPGISEYILPILDKSAFLEIKLYRDRVKEQIIGNRRENFSNDQAYEEPSKLIGTIGNYQSGNQAQINDDSIISAISINATNMSDLERKKIRYFMFADYDVAKQSAGLYQYRLEFKFKNGTYEYLYELYQILANAKILLQTYYDLAVSSYTDSSTAGFTYSASGQKEEYSKAVFKNYYKNGAYVQQFNLIAQKIFSESKPWSTIPVLLPQLYAIFLGQLTATGKIFELVTLINNLDPVTGSPKGIEHISKILNIYIRKLEAVLSINKIKKAGGGLTGKSNSHALDGTSILNRLISAANYTISEEHTFEHPRELFEAISNKNIYADYLSAASKHEYISPFQAMRVIGAPEFVERCHLEAAKMCSLAPQVLGGAPRFYTYNIYPWSPPINEPSAGVFEPAKQNGEDFFQNTGFSYLAPSIVELSDSSKENKNYDFKYVVFNDNPTSYLNSPNNVSYNTMVSGRYSTYASNHVYINLLNYSSNKLQDKNTDALDSSFSYAKAGVLQFKAGSGYDQVIYSTGDEIQREAFKRTFEEMGMTVHDTELHDTFFEDAQGHERESGAVSTDVSEAAILDFSPGGMKFFYKIEDFSDKFLYPKMFYNNFLRSGKQSLVKLTNNSPDYGYSKDLPNAFKFYNIAGNHKNLSTFGVGDIAQKPWSKLFAGPDNVSNDAFTYFNLNLTVKIEVFRGTSGNAKNDEDGDWSLLKYEDLSNATGMMFCRMSHYDEKLLRGLKLPILDKYFLISPGELLSGEAAVMAVAAKTEFAFDIADLTFWAEENEQKMDDYEEETGNSFSFEEDQGFKNAGQSNMDPPFPWDDDYDEEEEEEEADVAETGALKEEEKKEEEETAKQEGSNKSFGGGGFYG